MVRLPRFVVPWLTGLTVAGILVGAWALLRGAESRTLELSTSVAASQAAPRLADYVAARLTVVSSLAGERAQHDEMTTEDFVRLAQILETSFGGLLAINWIDADGVIRIAVPEARNRPALGRNVRNHPQAAPFFLEAERTRKPILTTSLDLFQGPRGVVSYFPVHRKGHVVGYVNGVFDCDEFVRSCLREGVLDCYLLRVSDEGGRIFESPGFGRTGRPVARAEARVANQTWWVEVEPGPALREASHSRKTDLLFVLAAVLGGAVSALTRSWLERRRAMAKLEEERRQLEQQMVESQKLEAIGRLAGGVAHDFNNLLTAMIGHAELAKRTKGLPEQVQEDLGVIVDAARRGAEITRDLLTFSRRDVVRPGAMEVTKEVKRLVPMLEHLLREDVSLEVELDHQAGTVHMDPSQLERALMNLVVNAVDAQPDGGRVKLAVSREGDSFVRVAVTDDGEGMSEEVAARAFEPFFTTKPAGKGTGLGLASVYGTARQVGGDVTLTTRPGHGTTVALLLPAVTEVDDEVPQRNESAKSTERLKLLLVEDDDAVRGLARRILGWAGYDVTVATDAAQALTLVENGAEPSILVTDQVMPGMRGHQLAAKLRDRLPELRVLVCSGHAGDLVDESAIQALEAKFLQKPYTPDQLLDALAELSQSRG